jgi:hypothetical protein
MAIGQNLFDAAHAEFGGGSSLLLATQVPRSASRGCDGRSDHVHMVHGNALGITTRFISAANSVIGASGRRGAVLSERGSV